MSNKKSKFKRQSLEFKNERLQLAKLEAKKRKGLCLSSKYEDSDSILRWECEFGHKWTASYFSVLNNRTWCPHLECKGKKISKSLLKTSIDDLKKFAKEKSGRCLSKSYSNQLMKYLWECSSGHRWEASWGNISQGKWCAICAGVAPLSIDDVRNDAKSLGLSLISKDYINNRTHVKVKCDVCAYQFPVLPSNIRHHESGCPRCSGRVVELPDVKALAKRRGGLLLSTKFNSAIDPLEWQCSNGHPFKLSYNKAQQGRWCPSCYGSFGERLVRLVFEEIFKKPFPKMRPKWLARRRSRLELDGYNEELGIAFEHQGLQHYEEISHWGPLSHVKERDNFKKRKCRNKSVILIEIPAIPDVIPLGDVGQEIIKILRRNQIAVPKDAEKRVDGIKTDCAFDDGRLRELKAFVRKKGGELISTIYAGERGKVLVRCKAKHTPWLVTPGHLKVGTWCPTCVGKIDKKIRFDELRKIISGKGGKMLSKEYLTVHTKYEVRCEYGHVWFPTAWNLRQGSWCRRCGYDRRRKT
jgi:hypothetical protein